MKGDAAALVVAAGAGRRFGGEIPKVFVPLAGAPILAWSLRVYGAHPDISQVCVVVSQPHLPQAECLCARELKIPWQVVEGGPQRRDSVRRGLLALSGKAPELVSIHDGARPLVSPEAITDGLRVARLWGAAVAAYPSRDTVKRVCQAPVVSETLDRACIYLAQTPQTFRFELILAAHQRAEEEGWEVTDDAMLLERLGHEVRVSEGYPGNMKITVPEDLAWAEWRLAARHPCTPRVGFGFDVHRLVDGRALRLGGITVPHDRGLLGHSDADVALHAVCDALLGAAALGDIGQHFPDTDPSYRDADSRELTRQVAALVRASGWTVGNVDVTVIAEQPRLASYIPAMRDATALALGCTPAAVSYKATTTEGLGDVGAQEAIAAQAVACLWPQQPETQTDQEA